MKPHKLALLTSVCLLTSTLALAADAVAPAPAAVPPTPAAKPAAGPVAPEAMNGLTFDGLTPEQKTLTTAILNENSCDCGCGMKLAVCRRDDAKCTRSLGLATDVISLVKSGKGRDEIVKSVLSPPSKYVAFALTPGDAPSVGPKDAKVTILAYYDYQCPFCSRIVPTLDQIAKDYPDSVRIVFKQHPLPMHPNAMPAAEAAYAAHAQGKFLEMDHKLFENQQQLTREKFVSLATELGLDVDRFTKELDAHTYQAVIQKEAKEVEDIGASGTPASFVNGRYLSGAKPYSIFKDMIDEELAWAKAGNRPEFKIAKNVSEASPKPAATAAGPDPNKVYDIAAGDAPFRGPAKAKVTILHYYDYQCPFCVRVAPTLEKLLADYPNDLRVVYKQHPLPMHKNAMPAAEAVMAANAQGKFGPMSEKLLANSAGLSQEKYLQFATDIGLDVKKFTSDLDTHAYKASIDAMAAEAMKLGATGTPASFVNGRFLSGAQPYEAFKKLIDEEIAKVTK